MRNWPKRVGKCAEAISTPSSILGTPSATVVVITTGVQSMPVLSTSCANGRLPAGAVKPLNVLGHSSVCMDLGTPGCQSIDALSNSHPSSGTAAAPNATGERSGLISCTRRWSNVTSFSTTRAPGPCEQTGFLQRENWAHSSGSIRGLFPWPVLRRDIAMQNRALATRIRNERRSAQRISTQLAREFRSTKPVTPL